MIDEGREAAVMQADLRDGMIPCGDCDFEEDGVSDHERKHDDTAEHLRRLDVEVEGVKLESSNAITALNTSLSFIGDQLKRYDETLKVVQSQLQTIASDVGKYNNVRERIDLLEQFQDNMGKNFVPREEFNGAFKSVRQQIRTLQWIFGIGFSLVGGLLTGVIVLLLGG